MSVDSHRIAIDARKPSDINAEDCAQLMLRPVQQPEKTLIKERLKEEQWGSPKDLWERKMKLQSELTMQQPKWGKIIDASSIAWTEACPIPTILGYMHTIKGRGCECIESIAH